MKKCDINWWWGKVKVAYKVTNLYNIYLISSHETKGTSQIDTFNCYILAINICEMKTQYIRILKWDDKSNPSQLIFYAKWNEIKHSRLFIPSMSLTHPTHISLQDCFEVNSETITLGTPHERIVSLLTQNIIG